jgi:hypothetical protein
MLRALSVLFLILSASWAYAECDFKTGYYIEQLQDSSSIQKIEIVVPKSAKYAKNFLKILTSGGQNILPKLRKKFKADIIVSYRFGRCVFSGFVRQNGDFKDHIKFVEGGQVTRSLDVKLKSGNIASAVAFKLLLPETRNGENEILTTLILKKLDIISPKTFSVITEVNGVIAPMLFQEKARKELLESNYRREGAIFEGDENLRWSEKFKDIDPYELFKISLSKIENENWFKKGSSSQSITLQAYTRLQSAYANSKLETRGIGYHSHIYLNSKHQSTFDEYLFLLLAMNADHGLYSNNRKYYFNSFTDKFEPIYYDGDATFTKLKSTKEIELAEWFLKKSMRSKLDLNFIKKIIETVNAKDLKEQFVLRASKLNINASKYYDEAITNLIFNINLLKKLTPNVFKKENKVMSHDTGIKTYLEIAINHPISHKIITNLQPSNDSYIANFHSGEKKTLSVEEVSEIISKNQLDGKRTVFIGNDTSFEDQTRPVNVLTAFPGSLTAKASVKVSVSKSDKILTLRQTNQDDWVLIQSDDLNGWEISFIGIGEVAESELSEDQRFNKYGLTGCLNIYNSTFKNTKINVVGGLCEDSVNIINSTGSIDTILVTGAFADALDIDFSTINISRVNIDNAGNDCLDVSGGNYEIGVIDMINCNDKGISVGEGSTLSAKKIYLSGANIGVASKDLSKVEILDAQFTKVDVCIEVMQKKQEFGGAALQVGNLECDGIIEVDKHSQFKVGLQ